jgi:hypothetical protein
MDNIIKNPILIAVVAGVIVYAYVTWKNNEKKNKKDKMNALLATGITTAIVWLIAYGYLNYKPSNMQNNIQPEKNVPTYKLVRDISESPKSFTLINPNGGISAPFGSNTQMPDLFINPF